MQFAEQVAKSQSNPNVQDDGSKSSGCKVERRILLNIELGGMCGTLQ